MKIILKSISLVNFKGIREKTVNFNEFMTNIFGKNESGKTTVFDAFTWLLFGKDSKDRKEFNIKTLDAENKAIERIPHEVSAILIVDGTEISLRKCYSEKWSKTKGNPVEDFKGHEVTQFINDVPCGAREYTAKIDEICPEQVFKLITSPLYFTSQKKDVQRKILCELAGNLTDADIAKMNPKFADLIASITGKTFEGYKKEIAVKKKKIKDELDGIQPRIDERKRDMPEVEDWVALQSEYDSKKTEIENIDTQIVDRSKPFEEAGKAREEKAKTLNLTRSNRNGYEHSLSENALRDFRKEESKRNELLSKYESLKGKESGILSNIENSQKIIGVYNQQREELLSEWRTINAEKLVFGEGAFNCPTCNRPLEIEDMEKKQAELTNNFNTQKAGRIAKNKEKGLDVKAKIEAEEEVISTYKVQLGSVQKELSEIAANPLYKAAPIQPTVDIESDAKYIEYTQKIDELQKELEKDIDVPDVSDLIENKRVLNEEIDGLRTRLANKTKIEDINKRVSELTARSKVLNEELSEWEGIEFTMDEFSKAKVEEVEKRTNSLFSLVKFKMYEQQINGGESETCEAMVDGVPFSDLNTASQINAGLDIINAICRFHNKYAPIFVDNAESVNVLLHTDSQMIRLIVSTDNELTIK